MFRWLYDAKMDFSFEVLIHDDASTDETQDIIREYVKKDPDVIKPIYQVENQYLKGIKACDTYNYPRENVNILHYVRGMIIEYI